MLDPVSTGTNIPKAFMKSMFQDYDTKRGRPQILNKIKQWKPSEPQPSLLLQGPPGLAKTMLACAALNERHAKYHTTKTVSDSALVYLRQSRYPVYFIQLSEFVALQLRLIRLQARVDRGTIDPTEYEQIDDLLEDLKSRVMMLVVDDVGKEHRTGTGFAQDEFDLLVRSRHNRGLGTIYTCNIPLEQWSDQYSQSMQNLIQRSSLVLNFQQGTGRNPTRRGVTESVHEDRGREIAVDSE